MRGPRQLPSHEAAPRGSGDATGHRSGATTSNDAWRRDRVQAFVLLDQPRLLQSYQLASLILRDRDEAEDATQEAIARAWSSWAALRDTGRFDAWFDRILVNVCRNRLRHVRTVRVVPLDDAVDVPAADAHEQTMAKLALEPAFNRLTAEQRIIVVLRFWRDLPVEDIAERLGIPAGTVKSRLHYALKSLREAIESSEEARR
ncbi:MAG: sigma-70 family RNA polymerase sigma factor [Candidatus Limnocylindrales bacterium]